MVFMAEHFRALRAERTVPLEPGAAIAQMQLALREGSFEPEQPGHLVPHAVGILDAAPQHHIASTLAVDRHRAFSQCSKPCTKNVSRRQRAGMEFWIASGQPYGVGGCIGRLVGQWRKR